MEDHIGYSLGENDIKKEEIDIEVRPIKLIKNNEVSYMEAENTEFVEIEKMESPKEQEISRLQCQVCYKIMGHRSSLYKHLKYVHKIEPAHRLPISCREKDCCQSFTFIDPFRKHLAEQHGFNIVVEKYIFQSMSDFFNWKKVTEEEENLRFIVSTGPRNSKGGKKTHYYRCQKNGTYKPEIKKRLQSDNRESIYNISTTHCISSMFVFEEPECVTVEFCRTHYGHEVHSKAVPPKVKDFNESCPHSAINEYNVNYETIDSSVKLKSFLSEKDKLALVNTLQENRNLLEEAEELFYENEQDVILKIPCSMLKTIIEESGNDADVKNDTDYDKTVKKEVETCEDPGFEKLDEEEDEEEEAGDVEEIEENEGIEEMEDMEEMEEIEEVEEGEEIIDNENSAILKSLGNGVFLDPASNKRLKLDSYKKNTKCTEKGFAPEETYYQQEFRKKEREKNNLMLVKEYLNEYDEKVFVLEMIKEEEMILQKRRRILSQLQTILIMINSEDNFDVLHEIENHLSKYAAPE